MKAKTQRESRKDKEANRRFWRAHVKAWRKSGYSRAEYCRLNNLSYYALTYWQRRTEPSLPEKATNSIIVPVAQVPARQLYLKTTFCPSITVQVQDRFKIEVEENFSSHLLTRLINTLEAC